MFKSHTVQNVEILRPLIDEYIVDMDFQDRTDTDYILTNILASLQNGTGRLMTDNPENPTAIIWATVCQNIVFKTSGLAGNIIYVKKSARGNAELIKDMMESLELAARFSGCDEIYGAKWHPKYGESAEKMWVKSDYVQRESYFVKELN